MPAKSSEDYIKVEVIKPAPTGAEALGVTIGALFQLAFITLIAWWFFATWFPELGLTYWGLVLPIYLLRVATVRRSEVRLLKQAK